MGRCVAGGMGQTWMVLQVEVRVESVDVDAGKMSLSMKPPEFLGDLIAPSDISFRTC